MTRNEIIFYIGIAVSILAFEFGSGCLAFPIVMVVAILAAFVFPISKEQ